MRWMIAGLLLSLPAWTDVTYAPPGDPIPKDKQTQKGAIVGTADIELGLKLAAKYRRPVMMFFWANW